MGHEINVARPGSDGDGEVLWGSFALARFEQRAHVYRAENAVGIEVDCGTETYPGAAHSLSPLVSRARAPDPQYGQIGHPTQLRLGHNA